MPRAPHFSPTSQGLSDRVYSELLERARGRRHDVISLHVGDTWLDPVPTARAEAQRSAEHERLHTYAAVQGEPMLLDEIVNYLDHRYGFARERACIQVTSGATTGLSIIAQTLLDPGDEVLLPSPFWPLIRGIISSRGAHPIEVPLFTELDKAGFDLEAALEARVTPRTVALYINAIHNPTGRVLDEATLEVFARVAERHDLWIWSDEAYEELCFEEPAAPLWTRPLLQDRVLAAHTISKGRGMAGARIGWVHGPMHAMQPIRAVNTFQSYGPARPMQIAGAKALADGVAWAESARAHYRHAAERAARALGVPRPAGGTFLFVDATPWLEGSETARPLLERLADEGVIVTAGQACGRGYERWIRLCYTAVTPEVLDEALVRIERVLARR